jgi:TolB-like protein/lipoprotein NlpI
VGAAYLAVAWLLIQVAQTVFPAFGLGATTVRLVIVVLVIGLLPVLIFAWAFEITPEGLKRESEVDRSESITPQTGKKLDRVIMGVLALALGYFAVDKFVLAPQREQAATEAGREEGRTESLVKSYGENSIAVLPFVNMSADKDQEYFSDGISEELLNLLAKIPKLRVISRSSAFSYKGKDVKLAQVARELNVAHILEGSVRKSGNKVRITAQLIEARSDTHLWSNTWDRELDDIFAVQDEIAAAVVEQLKVTLLGEAPKVREVNPEAYALFLQARQLSRQKTPEGYRHSTALFQQSLAIDPNFAAAWDGLASDYVNQVSLALLPIDEGYRLAREAVDKALAIDPDFALAHSGLGWIAMYYEGNLASAARHFQHALALEPTNTEIIRTAAALARSLGRLDKAVALAEFVTARDPLNAAGHASLGYINLLAGHLDAAIASYRAALSLNASRAYAHNAIGVALLLKGDPDGALAAMQRESSENWRLIGLPMAWHALGKKTESDAALDELVRKFAEDSAYNIAYVLAYRGEADRAFEWLDKAVTIHDPGLIDVAVDPLFANLHEDPRWLPFLRRLGRAPEQLATIKFDVKVPNST